MGQLDHLWAGWRSDFVVGPAPAPAGPSAPGEAAPLPEGQKPCVFCAILSSGLGDEESHIIWRSPGGLAFAIMNAYPYTSGHFMVMPLRHVGEVQDLTADEGHDLWQGLQAGATALKAAYAPQGLNLGANVGRAAGAGVPGHFHLHVLPRWVGDTNFMTSVSDARVLPEPLVDSAAKLRAAWPGA